MAFTPADWTVSRSTGNIRYTGADHDGTAGDFGGTPGTPSYHTVIEFHRWLQELADDAVAVGNDQLDITNTNPSQRSTDNIITLINGYNIDDGASEHLYDGSIIQNNGDDIYDGIVNFGNAAVQIQIIQNGAILADDWWNYNGAGLNASSTSGISHRFMIQTRSGAVDIDSRRIIGTCRRFLYTYSEFTINATSRGNNVLALSDSLDLNNDTPSGTVAGWSAAYTNTEGYALLDVTGDGSANEPYYSTWDIDTGVHTSINDFYEYTKYLSRDGSAATLYGISGELFRGITHEIALASSTGTLPAFGAVSWTGGTAQMLAVNSPTAATKMWIQLLTGTVPGTGVVITATGGTATTHGSTAALERTISKPFCGASTGSALIGSYGLGIVATDLNSTDKVFDLNNTQQTPPNNVTNTLTGLVSGEDRVLVAPGDGSTTDTNGDPAIIKTQMTIATTALTTADVTSIAVNDINPATMYPPSSGYIRVVDNSGYERRLHYSSYDAATNIFTIDTTDGNEDFNVVNANIGNNVYFAYIDLLASSGTASFTSVHSSGTLNLVILVRDGGDVGGTPIKQYISRWTQTSSSTSTAPILTSDS